MEVHRLEWSCWTARWPRFEQTLATKQHKQPRCTNSMLGRRTPPKIAAPRLLLPVRLSIYPRTATPLGKTCVKSQWAFDICVAHPRGVLRIPYVFMWAPDVRWAVWPNAVATYRVALDIWVCITKGTWRVSRSGIVGNHWEMVQSKSMR